MSIETTAAAFFEACESGKGWAGCAAYCHVDAGFNCQSGALAEVKTVKGYAEWMAGIFKPMPNASYDLKAFSTDEARGVVTAYAVFKATHSVDGHIPATGQSTSSDYVYAMAFEDGKVRHVTKIWNDAFALAELGWA
ncbi:MAG: nuclear transport factor 2 family protein [Pseudomonadota bacterium]